MIKWLVIADIWAADYWRRWLKMEGYRKGFGVYWKIDWRRSKIHLLRIAIEQGGIFRELF